MRFVIDNTVVMRWLFADESDMDRDYAETVLDKLAEDDAEAIAPGIWPLEVANVVARAEAKSLILKSRSAQFLRLLDDLAVQVDGEMVMRALGDILSLARRFQLSSYDASYLELALRESLPLATLDVNLRRAADQTGVSHV